MKRQENKCFICDDPIDLKVDGVDIDHITAISQPHNGVDDELNWAVTHQAHNRSKGDRDLQLMQYIFRFRKHSEGKMEFTVGDAMELLLPKRYDVSVHINEAKAEVAYPKGDGTSQIYQYPLIEDAHAMSSRSFVAIVPFRCLFHDKEVNPRSIVDVQPMIEEFYNKHPQLQPSLATLEVTVLHGTGKILLFDGQHKAAAQLYLNSPGLLCRVFVNADKTELKQTNFRAHTSLAQIHFPDIVEDKVGRDLFKSAFDTWRDGANLDLDSEESFLSNTEEDFRDYHKSYIKYQVLFGGGIAHPVLRFVETIRSRSRKLPLVYDTLDKTFFRYFLYLQSSSEKLRDSEALRAQESTNLSKLMGIFTDEILVGKFDFSLEASKIEEAVSKSPQSIPNDHLAAYRICRAPAMTVWMGELRLAVVRLLQTRAKYQKHEWGKDRPLWAKIEAPEWDVIRRMFQVVWQHSIWIEKKTPQILQAISSTRQKDWKEMLLDGKLPGREQALLAKLDNNTIFDNAIKSLTSS